MPVYMYSNLEGGFAIICACLASIAPIFRITYRRFFPKQKSNPYSAPSSGNVETIGSGGSSKRMSGFKKLSESYSEPEAKASYWGDVEQGLELKSMPGRAY